MDQANSYVDRSRQILEDCWLDEAADFLPPELLHFQALHWTGPSRQMHVLKAQLDYDRLPKPLKSRAYHIPASTILIGACVRVIDALESMDVDIHLTFGEDYDFELLKTARETIAKDPFKYHVANSLYGVAPTNDEITIVQKAKDMAVEFAALGQACVTMNVGRGRLSDITIFETCDDLDPAEQRRCEAILYDRMRES